MIEINLIPDVKQELIKAERVRAGVISTTILVGIISVGIIVVLAVLLGGQAIAGNLADDAIKKQNTELQGKPDLNETLTIQNQLTKLTQMHADKKINSRLFDLMVAVNPPAPNNVAFSNVKLDPATSTINIEGQAPGGYAAVEVFKKTILSTKIHYLNKLSDDGAEGDAAQAQELALASAVDVRETSYGEDASGQKVLRFVISFVYPAELLQSGLRNVEIKAPNQQENVTDSRNRIPQSLFTDPAADVKEEK
ncbi:hypothetical protein D3C73_21520 [compost metagenome]